MQDLPLPRQAYGNTKYKADPCVFHQFIVNGWQNTCRFSRNGALRPKLSEGFDVTTFFHFRVEVLLSFCDNCFMALVVHQDFPPLADVVGNSVLP